MDRLKTTLFTAFVIALSFESVAFGQATAARVDVVSGNGQLICQSPLKPNVTFFRPMVVKVSDANGNPISGKTVTWELVFAKGFVPNFDITAISDSDGLAVSRLSGGSLQGGTTLQPFLQTIISATADAASVNFTETQALVDQNGNQVVSSTPGWFPGPTPALTGPAGTTGTIPLTVRVFGYGMPVPNITVRLLSPEVTLASGLVVVDPNQASASCATGPGADPGSILTDSNGTATCYPVFGPVVGNGPVSLLVGGLDPAEFDQSITVVPLSNPIAYDQYSGIQLAVTAVTPGHVTITDGNNQTVNPGQASAPLNVKVTDLAGLVAIGNQTVAWTVISGAATVSPATSKTDTQGQAQTTVTFSPNATGQVTVRAALTGNYSGISTIFTLSTRVLIRSLTKVPGGDLQTTQAGQNFPSPLIVQVIGTNGLPVSNQPIGFAVTSGAAVLSTLSALTDATGLAQVTVTAGSTPGTVTISAFIATFSVTFTLTILPPGPAISSNSFYNAGGNTKIGALSPCSLVTVQATGLAPNVQGMVFNTNPFGPWATSLASDTVTVNSVAAPIYNVGNLGGAEQLTFQVPCETVPANAVPITINVAGGTGTITFPVVAASPGIFETVMSDGVRRAVVIRPDGSFVSPQNPARSGDVVRVFVTGMGPTAPAMVTGALPFAGADSLAISQVIVGVNNAGARVVTTRVSPNLIGVFEVAFQVPSDAPTGNDVVLNVVVNAPGDTASRYSNGSKLPIAQ